MKSRINLLLSVLFFSCISQNLIAQQGTYNSILLDNGNLNPFIEFTSPDDDDQFIVGFNERMGFYINNSYKFDIYSSAVSGALVLDAAGLTMKNALSIKTGAATWLIKSDGFDQLVLGKDNSDAGQVFIRGELEVLSDRNSKDLLEEVSSSETLEKLCTLPIYQYQFKQDDSKAYHLGPVAQDFHSIFQLGKKETTITPMDAIGIAFSSIQGLKTELDVKDKEIDNLKKEVADLKNRCP